MNYDESPQTPPQQSPVLDPYAPPSAQVAAPVYSTGAQAPLADRASRFGAQLLNGLTLIPGAIFIAMSGAFTENETAAMSTVGIVCVVLGVIYFLTLLVITLRLLGRQGQSLGKKWAKVRIVRTDGSPASLGRLVGLRYIVNAIPSAIPMVGGIYGLVDILFVFRGDRRCIHDMIADTKVVVA